MKHEDFEKVRDQVKVFRATISEIFRLLENYEPDEEISPVERLFMLEMVEL